MSAGVWSSKGKRADAPLHLRGPHSRVRIFVRNVYYFHPQIILLKFFGIHIYLMWGLKKRLYCPNLGQFIQKCQLEIIR